MLEYPKAMYIGTVQSHSHKLAKNLEHEAELRDLGFVDFVDLEKEVEKWSGESAGTASTEDFKNAFVPIEQFDEVCEKLVKVETQLGAAQSERDFYIQENQKLKEQLGKHNENEPVQAEIDYASMTSDQIRKILDEKGIKYLARDNKETLIALLSQPIKAEE